MSDNLGEWTSFHDIPLDILRKTPAGVPPSGVTPNFAHPTTCLPEVIAVCSVFLAIAFVCYVIRIYTKAMILRKWGWDDLTISIGFFLSVTTLGLFYNGSIHGAIARHAWEVHLDLLFNQPSLLICYWVNVLSAPSLALIKASLFIQYYSIFGRLRWMRWAVWIGATIHCIFYAILTLYNFALASPRNGEDLLDTITTSHFKKTINMLIPAGAIGLAIDAYLLILPIPAIMELRMDMRKKFGVIVIFSTGGLAVAASAACLVYRIRLQTDPSDSTWKIAYLDLSGHVEMFAGVTVSSMPSVKRFWKSITDDPSSRPFNPSATCSSHPSSASEDQHKAGDSFASRQSSYDDADADERFKIDAARILVTRASTASQEHCAQGMRPEVNTVYISPSEFMMSSTQEPV